MEVFSSWFNQDKTLVNNRRIPLINLAGRNGDKLSCLSRCALNGYEFVSGKIIFSTRNFFLYYRRQFNFRWEDNTCRRFLSFISETKNFFFHLHSWNNFMEKELFKSWLKWKTYFSNQEKTCKQKNIPTVGMKLAMITHRSYSNFREIPIKNAAKFPHMFV